MRTFKTILTTLVVALIVPAVSADVHVTFSEELNEKMDRIDAIEIRRETQFRKHGIESIGNVNATRLKFEARRYRGTEWGNERAIPELKDFSTQNLIAAMIERGVEEAAPGFEGDIHVHVKKLKVANFSLATLQSFQSWMEGDVTVKDADGNILDEHHINTGIVPKFSVSTRYKGRGYAFRDRYVGTRVGPIAAEFSQKALEKMYPSYDAPGLVVLR